MQSGERDLFELRARLRRVVGRDRVRCDPGELALYDTDALALHRATPGGVVQVASEEEVVGVLRIFAEAGVPFVARGAGTGLSGGAVPLAGAWVVDLNRMRRIIALHAEDRFAVVEPGVVNIDLDRAARAHGLRYAPDPSSQRASTIGGNVAENAGGPHCFLHGTTTTHVLGLTLILPDGERVTLGGPPGCAPDIDLRGLVVGAEGTLGVVTEIVVQLVPAPEEVRTYLAPFDSLAGACRAVASLIRRGTRPVALEILDRSTIRAVEASVFRAGYPQESEAVLLVELEGTPESVRAERPEVERACREERCLSFEEAVDEASRQRLWQGRKGAFGAMGRLDRDLHVLDGVVPRQRLAEVIARVEEIARWYGVKVSNVFHAGDGNLHPNISFDARDPSQVRKVVAAGGEILRVCVEAGGTISGEHGIGIEKRDHLPLVCGPDDIDAMVRLRDVFDPEGRCNPGKIFPAGEVAEATPPGGDQARDESTPGERRPNAAPAPPAARRRAGATAAVPPASTPDRRAAERHPRLSGR